MAEFLNEVFFIFQRLTWLSVVDILLVALIFFGLLYLVRDTQAMMLLRGIIFIVFFILLLTSLVNLPAFSWLARTALPGLLIAIPVIFAPEIRRALERLGRAGTWLAIRRLNPSDSGQMIREVVEAAERLSSRHHGALIVLQRSDTLDEYARSGVPLQAMVTAELLMQIFYPNTPLHDGAVILNGNRVVAAACVMPLSASGALNPTPGAQMGLRHRAALGISEASDAIAVVVSEETGSISIAHGGRMIRRLDSQRLENVLQVFYLPQVSTQKPNFLKRYFPYFFPPKDQEQ